MHPRLAIRLGSSWVLASFVGVVIPQALAQGGAAPPSTGESHASNAEPPGKDRKLFTGFGIESPNGEHALKLGALVQADGRFFLAGEGTDTFVARRARLDFRGTVAKYFLVRLQPELAGSTLSLLDAYCTVAFVDEIQLQVGKMKSPIGLELLQSPRGMPFAERGLPSLLVPNRDAGVLLQGSLFGTVVIYGVGVFNGVPDGANGIEDENDAKDVEGRLLLHPFATLKVDPLRGLGIGFAGTYGEQDGALPNYRTPGRQTFFAYVESDTVTAIADGRRVRFSPQGYYYYGPVGFLAEYVQRVQEVSDGTTTTELSARAWQAAASFVAGGTAGYRGAKVKTPLDPRAGGWGALEVALRYGELSLDRDAFDAALADPTFATNHARNLGAAASWWWFDGNARPDCLRLHTVRRGRRQRRSRRRALARRPPAGGPVNTMESQ